jgi:large subunit ribosomal protein L22
VDNAKYVAGEQGIDLDVDNLYVKLALANDGPRMKRIRPAPMGRAFRYQRRLTHIILSVAEREAAAGLVTKIEEPPVAPKASKTKVAESKAAPKASKTKAEEPKAAPEAAKATKKKAEEPQAAAKTAKATKKKANTKA